MWRRFLRSLVLVCFTTAEAFADGGALLARQKTGPFTVSVFGSPQPLRVGVADISVAVEKAENSTPLLDARVMVRLSRSDDTGISRIAALATHAKATNKLLYAAQLHIPNDGQWQLSVDVDAPGGRGQIISAVGVSAKQAPLVAYWPYFAIVPAVLLLFALNRYLKRRRSATATQVPHARRSGH